MSEESRVQSQADVDLGRAQYADENNPAAAITSWERAIRRNPENAEAHLYLGQALGELGQFERAEALLRRAVALYLVQSAEDERLRVPLTEARNTLGAVLINQRRYDEAIVLLRAASQEITYRSQHLVLGNLGLALLRKGTLDEAVVILERAVALQPNFCVGFTRLGEARLLQSDATHAVEALDRALGIQQRGCDSIQEAWLLRGRAHAALQHAEQSAADLRRCVEIAPRSAEGQACARLQGAGAP